MSLAQEYVNAPYSGFARGAGSSADGGTGTQEMADAEVGKEGGLF